MKRIITDQMLEEMAQLIYERLGNRTPWASASTLVKAKYLDAAHSACLLAAEHWDD